MAKRVFIADAARTPSYRYTLSSMTDLLAGAVRQLDPRLVAATSAVYVSFRYPTPLDQRLDPDDLVERVLRPSRGVRLRIDPFGLLGGLDVVDQVVSELRNSSRTLTILVLGGEVFNPELAKQLPTTRFSSSKAPEIRSLSSFKDHDAYERRRILNEFAPIPREDRHQGLTTVSAHAFLADALFREHHLSRDEISQLMSLVSCHLEKYAQANPNSYQRTNHLAPIREAEYRQREDTRINKWPFSLLDMCPISSGASALILTNRRPSRDQRWVEVLDSIVVRREGSSTIARDPIHLLRANAELWQIAARRLKVSFGRVPTLSARGGSARRQRLLVELFDAFAFQIPMTLLDMGMYSNLGDIMRAFTEGRFDPYPDKIGAELQVQGAVAPSCQIILNPSGGAKDGHPLGAYALVRTAECTRLLRGDHGQGLSIDPRQVHMALVHALSLADMAGVLALRPAANT